MQYVSEYQRMNIYESFLDDRHCTEYYDRAARGTKALTFLCFSLDEVTNDYASVTFTATISTKKI